MCAKLTKHMHDVLCIYFLPTNDIVIVLTYYDMSMYKSRNVSALWEKREPTTLKRPGNTEQSVAE